MRLDIKELSNVCRENMAVKILAVSLATISIYSIQRITNQTDEFEVPIQIEVAEGMSILRQDARSAYITCRGSREDLRRLDQSQVKLLIRPQTTGIAGKEIVPIGLRNVQGVPRSISVVKVRPNLINLTFDREIEKRVSVARPELVGKPAIGRAELDYTPKIVTVRGPEQLLSDLKIMQTPPIDIANAKVSFAIQLPILTDEQVGVWEVIPEQINAEINIVTEAVNREWNDIPVLILRNPDTDLVFKPTPPFVSVNLLGSPQAVNRLSAKDIRVFIDCTTINEVGDYEIAATAHFERSMDISRAVTPPVIEVSARQIPKVPTPVATDATGDEKSQPVENDGIESSTGTQENQDE